jgi:hypothetical protein
MSRIRGVIDKIINEKKLKLPATEDSQAKEVVETEGHKEEILKLIMEHNAQIR